MQRIVKALAAVMLLTVMFTMGCAPEEDPYNGGNNNGDAETHEYVDLNLPSGTLWATCNLGADTPEGYGDYFAWGETQSKTSYDWSTYKYCKGGFDQLIKYCNASNYGYHGFKDDLSSLLPEDDAATVNWGNDWCMPTTAQWGELYQNTTNNWTTQNGVNGILFTASNGNSLFLPAAGFRSDDDLNYVGAIGYYWSSILCPSPPCTAWYFDFVSYSHSLDYGILRNCGQSVRAVRSVCQN